MPKGNIDRQFALCCVHNTWRYTRSHLGGLALYIPIIYLSTREKHEQAMTFLQLHKNQLKCWWRGCYSRICPGVDNPMFPVPLPVMLAFVHNLGT